MPSVMQSGVVAAGSLQAGLVAMPSHATVLRARLSVVTTFTANTTAVGGMGWAPPNTILGISLRASGTAPLLPTYANEADPSWMAAGFGDLTACDSFGFSNNTNAYPTVMWQSYGQVLEVPFPVPTTSAQSVGYAFNWLGFGFWPSVAVQINYTFSYVYE